MHKTAALTRACCEFALFQFSILVGLFIPTYFVKCMQRQLNLNSKASFFIKFRCCLFMLSIKCEIRHFHTKLAKKCTKERDTRTKLLFCLLNLRYTCQLSRVRVENFDLMPAHDCGPISHPCLKNVSCGRLAWHNFQKYVNSDPRKERQLCVKWINGNTFLAISDFWSEKQVKTSKARMSSEDFRLLRNTSHFFGNLRKWLCRLQKSQHSQDKNLTLISQKKLAGILLFHWCSRCHLVVRY